MRVVDPVVLGHFISSFNQAANGFLTGVLGTLFFSNQSGEQQLLFSYATYCVVFVVGPIGAFVLGRIGDSLGTRRGFLLSVLGIVVPFVMVGCLPTSNLIGSKATMLLVILYAVQGFFSSSEYSGAFIFNRENGNRDIKSAANLTAVGFLAGAISASVCFLSLQEGLPSWSWRIPYWFSGVLSLLGVLLSKNRLLEYSHNVCVHWSRMDSIRGGGMSGIITATLITASSTAMYYSSVVFGSRLFQQLGRPVPNSMIFFFCNMVLCFAFIKIFGRIFNGSNMKKMLMIGFILSLTFVFPVVILISLELSMVKVYLYMIAMTIFCSWISSCSAAYIMNLFPKHERYTKFALSDCFGTILGGMSPFMMMLFSSIFKTNLACAIWLYALIIPTFIMLLIDFKRLSRKRARRF